MADLKRATSILIVENGRILAINKHNADPPNWGLIGGKCEIGESFEDAAIRELKEEAGLHSYDMRLVFERQNGDYLVQTFIPDHYYGDICSSDEGQVFWITSEELVSGAYGDYNRELLKKVGML